MESVRCESVNYNVDGANCFWCFSLFTAYLNTYQSPSAMFPHTQYFDLPALIMLNLRAVNDHHCSDNIDVWRPVRLSQTQTLPTTTNTTHLKDILRAATPSQAKLINLYWSLFWLLSPILNYPALTVNQSKEITFSVKARWWVNYNEQTRRKLSLIEPVVGEQWHNDIMTHTFDICSCCLWDVVKDCLITAQISKT